MKELMQTTRLKTGEVAEIVGVTRITVYKWCRGTKPHSLLRKRVSVFEDIIQNLVNSKQLPFPVDMDPIMREQEIEQIRQQLDVMAR